MKLRTGTYSILILIAATLPYIHDVLPKHLEFPGFSSMRVAIFVIGTEIFALIGWILAFVHAKGKEYRFVMALPIITVTYELIVKILNLKSTSFNELNLKYIITFSAFTLLVIWYFINKNKNE